MRPGRTDARDARGRARDVVAGTAGGVGARKLEHLKA
jgi:hypothetical protein